VDTLSTIKSHWHSSAFRLGIRTPNLREELANLGRSVGHLAGA
jgi:hypothetical protein